MCIRQLVKIQLRILYMLNLFMFTFRFKFKEQIKNLQTDKLMIKIRIINYNIESKKLSK